MSSNYSGDDWATAGREVGRMPGPRHGKGFAQPATDSQLLRQFANAYEEQVRHTVPLASYREPELRSQLLSWPLLLGLVLFVVLLAVAMGLAVLLIHPR